MSSGRCPLSYDVGPGLCPSDNTRRPGETTWGDQWVFYVFFPRGKTVSSAEKKNKSTRNKGQYPSDPSVLVQENDPRMDYPKKAGSYLDIHEMGRVPNLVGGFDLCDNMSNYI